MAKLSTLYLNQYAQDLIDFNSLYGSYSLLSKDSQDYFKEVLIDMILQAKCRDEDVDIAISHAHIKSTKNCCVVVKKGIHYYNLKRSFSVDKEEVTMHLLASLFRVGYLRNRNSIPSDKWWYGDLKLDKNASCMFQA